MGVAHWVDGKEFVAGFNPVFLRTQFPHFWVGLLLWLELVDGGKRSIFGLLVCLPGMSLPERLGNFNLARRLLEQRLLPRQLVYAVPSFL
jgi:hypothetical protein